MLQVFLSCMYVHDVVSPIPPGPPPFSVGYVLVVDSKVNPWAVENIYSYNLGFSQT